MSQELDTLARAQTYGVDGDQRPEINDRTRDLRATAEFAGHVKVDTSMRYTRVRSKRMVDTMMEGLDYFDDSADEEN